MKKLFAIALITAFATGANAHSKVDTTTPEDGTTIAEAPSEVSFRFTKDIRLTRVGMAHEDHPEVGLDLGDQTNFGRDFSLPLEGMGEGTYHIKWRGLGADGHAMQGEFSFTVD